MNWVLLFIFLGATSVQAEPWGTLTGQIVYDGVPPERKPILIDKDKQYCGKFQLLEEDLLVDAKTRGLANVVVWIYRSRRESVPLIHESYAGTEKATVVLDSEKCRITPHVTLLRTTQTLLLRNTDTIGDGLKIDCLRNPPVNIQLAPHAELRRHFPNPERFPAPVTCPVHLWESGWLLVLPHPYMAVSNVEGRFEIKHIPVGEWTFQFWHERSGCPGKVLGKVTMNNQPETWPRGRVKLDIHEGVNDLGVVEIAPELL